VHGAAAGASGRGAAAEPRDGRHLMDPARPPVVRARDVTRVYPRGAEPVRALEAVNLEIAPGEFVAVVGPSGAGKTTLLNLIGCLDVPTSGSLQVCGHELAGLKDAMLTRLRRDHIGFVFQQFALLPTLTVAENVGLPGLFAGRVRPVRVQELLAQVGLTARRDHRPHELSGGELQRAAIARALVNDPELVLCDEPTGNLDTQSAASIYDLLRRLNQERGQTVVVVTHDAELAERADRVVRLVDGRIVLFENRGGNGNGDAVGG